MEIRKDLLGKEPEIGSFIAYNPPYYKGLKIGKVMSFTKSGLPLVVPTEDLVEFEDSEDKECYLYSPKTGFVIVEDTLRTIE